MRLNIENKTYGAAFEHLEEGIKVTWMDADFNVIGGSQTTYIHRYSLTPVILYTLLREFITENPQHMPEATFAGTRGDRIKDFAKACESVLLLDVKIDNDNMGVAIENTDSVSNGIIVVDDVSWYYA